MEDEVRVEEEKCEVEGEEEDQEEMEGEMEKSGRG